MDYKLDHLGRLKSQLQRRYEKRNSDIDFCVRVREQAWPKTFPRDPNKEHPWIRVNRRFYSMVKPVFTAIADESLARIEAAIGIGLPMPQEHYFRDAGVADKSKKEAWLRSLQLRLDRQHGISQYARAVYNIVMMGRSARLSHPTRHALDFYSKGLLKRAEDGIPEKQLILEARSKPPFINYELDPRTVYPYPNEWEPREAFIIEERPLFDACVEYGVELTRDGKGMRKLGEGQYPDLDGFSPDTSVEVVTYWNEDVVCRYVTNQVGQVDTSWDLGLMIDEKPVEHGYGEILERVGAPNRIPIFITPGMMRGWGEREAMPLLLEIAPVLSAYDSAMTMSLAYAMASIPRQSFKNENISRTDPEAAEVAPTDEDLEGDVVTLYKGEDFSNMTSQLPIEGLEKQKDDLRHQIDEFFVGYVMRGTPPGSLANVSGNVVNKMQVASIAPFLQLSHNLDERDSSIFRFWLGSVESIYESKIYVWDSAEGKDIGLGPDDIKGDYLVFATSETGLPDSRIIEEEMTARRVKDGYELPSTLLRLLGHRDIDTFLERLLDERSKWLYADGRTQMMIQAALTSLNNPSSPPEVVAPAAVASAPMPTVLGEEGGETPSGGSLPVIPRGGPGGIPSPQSPGGTPPNAGIFGQPSNAGPGGEVLGALLRQVQAETEEATP